MSDGRRPAQSQKQVILEGESSGRRVGGCHSSGQRAVKSDGEEMSGGSGGSGGNGGNGGWVPLEANPDVLNKYLERGGVRGGCRAVDVLGLEGEPLEWVPRPVIALLLLFPCSERYETHKRQENQRIKDHPQHVSPNVFHMRQTVPFHPLAPSTPTPNPPSTVRVESFRLACRQ